jgi:hypothetical protein
MLKQIKWSSWFLNSFSQNSFHVSLSRLTSLRKMHSVSQSQLSLDRSTEAVQIITTPAPPYPGAGEDGGDGEDEQDKLLLSVAQTAAATARGRPSVCALQEKTNQQREEALTRTGRLFGGLILDVKRKLPW